MNDEITEERTLKAMDYNIRCKEEMINKLIADNLALEEENKRLKGEVKFLEHLRATSI